MMPFKKLARGYALYGALAALLMVLSSLVSSPARAAVLSASGSPSSVGVASNAPSTVTINWQLMITVPAGTTTFSSANGTLTACATSLGAYGGALSRTLPFSAPTTRTLTITETLTINRALARRIAQEGGVVFSRSFTDGAGSAVAAVTLVPTGTSADLSLQNLELRFDDDAQYRIVGQKDSLTARAIRAMACCAAGGKLPIRFRCRSVSRASASCARSGRRWSARDQCRWYRRRCRHRFRAFTLSASW